ncbi:MAG: extracellular solute-binding protein [Alphaproteobacteria bacterium]|nr:extracellular solute-binding protein [Alphaproteobacteria bacterium]
MSRSNFTSNLRCSPATAFSIGLFLACGIAALQTAGAIAQPSPPEPAAEAEAKATAGPNARPADAVRETSPASEAKPAGETESKAEGATPRDEATAPAKSDEANPSGETATTGDAKPAEPAHADRTPAAPEPAKPAAPKEPEKAARAPEADMTKLRVATWPGGYGEAQRAVVIERFKAKRSISIDVVERNGKDPIDLTPDSGSLLPDAAEFSGEEIDAGCRAGQLLRLEDGSTNSIVAPAITSDFLPGSLKPCGIGAFAWSHILAVNPSAFENSKPESLTDVFDVKRFPGKRAFMKEPRFLMEVALMADGAEPAQVYDLLGSEDGLQRAFAKLASIRDDILWVGDSQAAMEAVAKGDAVIAQSFSGRAFFAAARGAKIEIIWDGQIYAMTYWAIPSKSPRQELARAFLDFATEPQQLAAVAQRFPYGPTRTSALALTKRHLSAGLDLEAYLPTAPVNLKTALSVDEGWWAKNGERLEAAFAGWIAKPSDANVAPGKSE